MDDTSNGLSKEAKDLRIVFLGTPDFAVASLDALVTEGFQIVGVITAPDKAAGRGLYMQQSAVKGYAVQHGIPLLQPEKLKDPTFLGALEELKPDIQVVVAFRMLPEVVWKLPPGGTINVHGSLLPQYRGAAPINWVIINGEKETGITTFKLQHQIDTGDILLQEKVAITPNETAGKLHDKLKEVGAQLLVKTIKGLANGTLNEKPQSSIVNLLGDPNQMSGNPNLQVLKHAPKLTTETCKIDWNKPVEEVFNLIRGLSPYPAAFTELKGKKLKILAAEKHLEKGAATPGTIETDNKTFFRFACADGFIGITELQLEGKKKLAVEEFLRGYRAS